MHSASSTRGHLGGCAGFWAWALVGAVLMAGLDVVVLLPLAGALALAVARLAGMGRPVAGIGAGAGLPLILVAYLNRQGPGSVCTAHGCDSYLDPWPWFAAGVALVAISVWGYARDARRG